MVKTSIQKLNKFGQSIWLDNINRQMLETGTLKKMISLGLRGVTSNPTIFDNAISRSNIYDSQIEDLCRKGKNTFEIYDELTIKDIQDAADIFKELYEESNGLDGYISLEVNPILAYKTKETIEEAERLFKKVKRENVMFKVPSTKEGFRAIEELIASGINVNVTLIFSEGQYVNTAKTYLRGIKRLLQNKGDASRVRSVASVFVSRIDTVCDKLLDDLLLEKIKFLRGKAAAANSALIYKRYLEIFSSDEFKELKNKGANIQRLLWGSTSTKNPVYSDIKYVTELIAKNTINTMPEKTLEAFLDHGEVKEALTENVKESQKIIDDLKTLGIDINEVCAKLLKDGVIAFSDSFNLLLNAIERKTGVICKK